GGGAAPPAKAAPPPAPEPLPAFVKEASPAARKAVVQALAEEEVGSVLAKAPWRRAAEAAKTPGASDAPKPRATVAPMKAPAAPTLPVGKSEKRVVLLDANALMMQFQFHIDIEAELKRILNIAHEVAVPSIVVDELKALAAEVGGKEAAEARMAVELAKTFRIIESPGEGDTGILRLAEKMNATVVTNDKVLRARLRAKNIPNVYMRSRAFLTLEGHIPGM
ncbi:MAG TPA: hypothetical protein VM889_13680, partial [Candidatus Thermoplasmatota archaeon]|nr:hypothetical protein [Candidatus Thermoplasmatota archaeon]